MQKKETVVFITESKAAAEKIIAAELTEDAEYLGAIVPVSKLIPFGGRKIAVIKRVLKLYVWRPIANILHKITKRVERVRTPVRNNALSKSRVQNMLFRFSPKAIVVSKPDTLYALKELFEKTVQKTDLFVFADNLDVNPGLIDKEVKHYFVDNMSARETLLKQGVFAENVTVEPLPVKRKYFAERAQVDSKRNLGFSERTNLVLLCVNKKNYRKLIDFAAVNNDFTQYAVLTDEANIQVYAEGKKIVSFDKSVHNEELFNAADVVVSGFDGYLIKRVAARGKGTIVFGDCGMHTDRVKALQGENRVLNVLTTEELGEALMHFFNGELTLLPDETDIDSAKHIAEKMKALLRVTPVTEEE